MKNFKPLKDNVIVKLPQLKKVSDGGVLLPQSVIEKRAKDRGLSVYLEVVAVGPDCKKVEVGMKVLTYKAPMLLPNEDASTPEEEVEFVLAFVGEYAIEGYI